MDFRDAWSCFRSSVRDVPSSKLRTRASTSPGATRRGSRAALADDAENSAFCGFYSDYFCSLALLVPPL